jgi:hypothetical protein
MMKVAIIGFSKSSYDDAPWDDPEWEKWGMPWDAKGWQRYTRLFEMHSPILWDLQLADPLVEFWDGEKFHRKTHRVSNYYKDDGDEKSVLVSAANSRSVRLYVQNGIPDIKCNDNVGLIEYPFKWVNQCVEADYYQSSVAYALALAIAEMEHVSQDLDVPMGEHEIGLWGIDVSDDSEWAYQRACLEYLVGIARGKGINVHIPESSALCKFQTQMIKFGAVEVEHTGRYGLITYPQTFKRWTLGDKYTLCQLRRMDLPEELKRQVEFEDSMNDFKEYN